VDEEAEAEEVGVKGTALARRLARNTGPRGEGEAAGGGHMMRMDTSTKGLPWNIATVCIYVRTCERVGSEECGTRMASAAVWMTTAAAGCVGRRRR